MSLFFIFIRKIIKVILEIGIYMTRRKLTFLFDKNVQICFFIWKLDLIILIIK